MAKGKYEKWIKPDGLLLLEGWAKDGLTDEQIAHNMGISRKTLAQWKKKHSVIGDTLKKGKEVVDYEVENALLKRALGYEYKEIIKERINDDSQKQRHKGDVKLTEKQWEIIKSYFNKECCYCGKKSDLTKDHIKPLINGGKMVMSNIVPCCKNCNSSKKDNEMLSWYQRQSFYDMNRAKKIFDYVTFAMTISNLFEDCKEDNNLIVTKEVIKYSHPDTTAQIFWLKNRRPDKWRDKVENMNINQPDREVNINIISTKDLKK